MKRNEEIMNTEIPKTPIRFLWYASRPHVRFLILGIGTVTLAQISTTSVPYIVSKIIDTATRASEGVIPLNAVWYWIIAYALANVLLFFFWRMSGFLGANWVTRMNATAYKSLFSYLTEHSHAYFSNRFAGSLSSKVSHASEGVQSLSEAFLWNYYATILSLSLTVGYIWSTSITSGLVFVALLAFLIPINIFLAKRRHPHVVQYSAQATKARGFAVDAISNMSAVRQFDRMEHEKERFAEQINTMRLLNIKQWNLNEWILALNNVIILSFELVILYIVTHLWMQGGMSLGELVMVVTLMVSVQGSLVFIGSSMNGFIRRYGEIQEGLDDILTGYDVLDSEDATELVFKGAEVVWKDVSFDYDGNEVFKDFNLTIQRGERIGLVGGSGAGKTTFVSLLLRQHDVQKGSICIDGKDIAHVTQSSLRKGISVVPQEPLLFHRSIRENIAYGKLDATDDEIIAVAKKAHAHEFISTLKDGYETLVGERGVKLSGGQKQRVAIARAMIKNALLLILDEATSALDSESEVAIQEALHELMEGKTVIAIAHRLSTLREMDRIIVLDTGKIVEDGTHDELVKRGGLYARLWEHQAGGFLQE